MLASKANPNCRDSVSLLTPLHEAAQRLHKPVVRVLLSARADPFAQDEGGSTAAHRAVAAGSVDIALAIADAAEAVAVEEHRTRCNLLREGVEDPDAKMYASPAPATRSIGVNTSAAGGAAGEENAGEVGQGGASAGAAGSTTASNGTSQGSAAEPHSAGDSKATPSAPAEHGHHHRKRHPLIWNMKNLGGRTILAEAKRTDLPRKPLAHLKFKRDLHVNSEAERAEEEKLARSVGRRVRRGPQRDCCGFGGDSGAETADPAAVQSDADSAAAVTVADGYDSDGSFRPAEDEPEGTADTEQTEAARVGALAGADKAKEKEKEKPDADAAVAAKAEKSGAVAESTGKEKAGASGAPAKAEEDDSGCVVV